MFVEVRTTHRDSNGVIHIDGYKDFDENSEGVGIGYIFNGEVYWRNPEYQFHPLVKQVVKDALANLEPFILKKLDYNKLKLQKQHLLELQDNYTTFHTHKKSLQGIINLIDSIQDYAVDVMGKTEEEVFNFKGD